MPISACYLFKNSFEYKQVDEVDEVPRGVRGIYVLFRARPNGKYDVVHIGIAQGKVGAKSRLRRHRKKKAKAWTHFSVYEVWDNIPQEQVIELKGLFRHIYRYDSNANVLNRQKAYTRLNSIKRENAAEWLMTPSP